MRVQEQARFGKAAEGPELGEPFIVSDETQGARDRLVLEDFPRKGRQGVQGRPLVLRFERGEAAHDIGDIAQQEAAVSQFFREAIGCLSLDRFDGTEGAVAQTMSPAFAKECRCLQLFINVPQKGSSAGVYPCKSWKEHDLVPSFDFLKSLQISRWSVSP